MTSDESKSETEYAIRLASYALLFVLGPIVITPRHSMSRFAGWVWSPIETVVILGGTVTWGYVLFELSRVIA